jgi:2-polyprenyl-3-methyl-5-hydroxy-6-metoxy-1,4-benzoquinol methylase
MLQRISQLRRDRFDQLYSDYIIGNGFFESDEYYRLERERYWRSLEYLARLPLRFPARILEIGGGQIAILCKHLFGDECEVGDVSDTYRAPLDKHGISFFNCNLLNDSYRGASNQFDCVVLLEVIEHLPIPPYIIFNRLKGFLKPGGILLLTTPNLFRLRNLVRMLLGIEFLDHFMYPDGHRGLGHQLEYSAEHLLWQFSQAGMEVIYLKHDELGHVGHSTKAKLARRLLAPLRMRGKWRDELIAAARMPVASKN